MGLVLYDNPVSSNALKARLMLCELGLPYERRTVPFELPRPDWYLAVNPIGGIPALGDGDLVISESNTVLRYLAEREARDDLYPVEPRERALVDEFLDRWALTFRPAFFPYEAAALGFTPGKGMGIGERDPESLPALAAAMEQRLTLLDTLVAPDGAVLGRFTIADIAATPILYRTTHTGLDLTAYPQVTAWREVLLRRPAVAAAEPVL